MNWLNDVFTENNGVLTRNNAGRVKRSNRILVGCRTKECWRHSTLKCKSMSQRLTYLNILFSSIARVTILTLNLVKVAIGLHCFGDLRV